MLVSVFCRPIKQLRPTAIAPNTSSTVPTTSVSRWSSSATGLSTVWMGPMSRTAISFFTGRTMDIDQNIREFTAPVDIPHTRFKSMKLPLIVYVSFLFAPPRMSNSSLFVLIRVASNWCSVQLHPYSCLIGYPGIETSVRGLFVKKDHHLWMARQTDKGDSVKGACSCLKICVLFHIIYVPILVLIIGGRVHLGWDVEPILQVGRHHEHQGVLHQLLNPVTGMVAYNLLQNCCWIIYPL